MIISCYSNPGKIIIFVKILLYLFYLITTVVVQIFHIWLTTSLFGSKLKSSQLILIILLYFKNIWHYRDNRDTWLYYRDGRIFIIAQPYFEVIVYTNWGADKRNSGIVTHDAVVAIVIFLCSIIWSNI